MFLLLKLTKWDKLMIQLLVLYLINFRFIYMHLELNPIVHINILRIKFVCCA